MTGLSFLPPEPLDGDARARNVRLLSVLRSLAIGGQLATILLVRFGFGVPLPLAPMIAALAVLVALNLLIGTIAARRQIGDAALFATLLVDVICLTVQLYLSGGVTNPFVGLYLLQVVIAAVLLPAWASWALVALTSVLFAWLGASPFRLPAGFGAAMSPPHIAAAWVSFTLAAILLVLFVTRIVRNLAEREARLADLRQRAAEEDHIVRMGLLASGAAHELGTPLASMAVMIGDWRHDPALSGSPALMAELDEMAGQIGRCKDIVGQVLLAAGEVRGDAPVRTTLRHFVRDVVDNWESATTPTVEIDDALAHDPPIIADEPLAQTIVNLLDNAAEAGATCVHVSLRLEGETVRVTVRDDGRGFAPAILRDFGKPYRSTKTRHGAGLGLFLATNVLRTLGGRIEARDAAGGGGEVTLTWPLSAVAVESAS
ncbi:ATP-binding protein [Sphingomonas jatrophae]|uniref:histidine kinase n=1 Tax=Sphingomonas jatrophae TaxID=1166337 RepID=A0A1I6JAQ6_9SPHN|nr:ATP-binding protein [Sphingomonas jatrophae]SFR76026.1 two-component system, sensor histidine kinase RegB [Sphingomonas jatrophae]